MNGVATIEDLHTLYMYTHTNIILPNLKLNVPKKKIAVIDKVLRSLMS